MTGTTTTRMALYKPNPADLVNVITDINNNMDLIDAKMGTLACTSSTRPSTPLNGQTIRETDTGRIWVSNGSSPASGSWSEIATPGTAQTFTAAATFTAAGAIFTRTSAANPAARFMVGGDAADRLVIGADGKMLWGGGATAGDVNLYRSATDTLKTDDSFIAVGTISGSNYPTDWTAFTPTWAGLSTLGSAVSTGKWIRHGKLVHMVANLAWGTSSSLGTGAITVSLPVAAAAPPGTSNTTDWGWQGTGRYRDGAGASWKGLVPVVQGSDTTAGVFALSTTGNGWVTPGSLSYVWASGASMRVQLSYEI